MKDFLLIIKQMVKEHIFLMIKVKKMVIGEIINFILHYEYNNIYIYNI